MKDNKKGGDSMIIENCVRALKNIQRMQDGETVYLNPQDCEECVKQGWAEPLAGGTYGLTDDGRAMLKKHA
jgi:hypothetical protein